MKKRTVLLVVLLGILGVAGPGRAGLPSFVGDQSLPSLAPVLEKTMPAVVNISTQKNIQVMEHPLMRDPFFRHFFQLPNRPLRKQQNSLGSGVIIDKDAGYVITNNHVIDKADEITVTLKDGRQLKAELVGKDPEADIAVIQIEPENLTELPIADSDQLRVGDFVIAIGNPFGLGQTVTSGIISALGRSGLGIEGYEDFIQTDASINPGNSGGALINLRGELIGINTAILAPSGGNVGIGFAIPSNMAIKLKQSLVEHGEVRRGLLGVTTQDLNGELVKAFNLKSKNGALISKIQENSPAQRAGLEPGDIIVEVNGKPVRNSVEVRNIIGLLQVGEKVELVVMRGKKTMTFDAVIGKQQQPLLAGEKLHRGLQGAGLTATPRDQVEGVLISSVQELSTAWRAGLRPGDVIVAANRYRIRSLEDLAQVVNPRGSLLLNIQRGGEAFFLVLQ
ncbi:MAG: DegQ family serine endoprotease [Gammaproteobacteria bacterium]